MEYWSFQMSQLKSEWSNQPYGYDSFVCDVPFSSEYLPQQSYFGALESDLIGYNHCDVMDLAANQTVQSPTWFVPINTTQCDTQMGNEDNLFRSSNEPSYLELLNCNGQAYTHIENVNRECGGHGYVEYLYGEVDTCDRDLVTGESSSLMRIAEAFI